MVDGCRGAVKRLRFGEERRSCRLSPAVSDRGWAAAKLFLFLSIFFLLHPFRFEFRGFVPYPFRCAIGHGDVYETKQTAMIANKVSDFAGGSSSEKAPHRSLAASATNRDSLPPKFGAHEAQEFLAPNASD